MVVCGRRFGKTGIDLAEIINVAKYPDKNIAYVAPTNKQSKEVFWNWLKATVPNDWKLRTYETAPYTIQLLNGTNIQLYGADAHDRIRGRGYDLIVCDEFQDYSKDAWFTSIFPALADRQGRAVLTGTPKGKSNWGYEITQDSNYKFFHFTTADGGWVKQSEIELAKKMLPPMEFRQEFEASFETSGLVVYYSYDRQNNTDIEFDVSRETILCFDFNVSPMSCIIVQKVSDNLYVAVKEFILNNSNTHDICEAVLDYLQLQKFNNKLTITGDNAGIKRATTSANVSMSDYVIINSYFKNFKDYSVRKRPTKSIKDRVTSLNAMLCNTIGERKLLINVNKCPRLHKDLINVEWVDSGFQLNGTNRELTHASDALSYFAMNWFPANYLPMTVY